MALKLSRTHPLEQFSSTDLCILVKAAILVKQEACSIICLNEYS